MLQGKAKASPSNLIDRLGKHTVDLLRTQSAVRKWKWQWNLERRPGRWFGVPAPDNPRQSKKVYPQALELRKKD